MKFKENLVEIMKQEKVAVHCDKEEKAMALLEELGKCGVRWATGKIANDYTNWRAFKEDTCYSIECYHLVFSPKYVYMSERYRIIEFEELLEKEATLI